MMQRNQVKHNADDRERGERPTSPPISLTIDILENRIAPASLVGTTGFQFPSAPSLQDCCN